MATQVSITRAASALVKYDAIAHDLYVRASDVLRSRLLEVEAEILALTGAESVQHARQLVHDAQPEPKPKPVKKPKASKKDELPYYRGQDSSRRTAKSYGRAQPESVTSVVFGGLPASSRRH